MRIPERTWYAVCSGRHSTHWVEVIDGRASRITDCGLDAGEVLPDAELPSCGRCLRHGGPDARDRLGAVTASVRRAEREGRDPDQAPVHVMRPALAMRVSVALGGRHHLFDLGEGDEVVISAVGALPTAVAETAPAEVLELRPVPVPEPEVPEPELDASPRASRAGSPAKHEVQVGASDSDASPEVEESEPVKDEGITQEQFLSDLRRASARPVPVEFRPVEPCVACAARAVIDCATCRTHLCEDHAVMTPLGPLCPRCLGGRR